MSLRGGKQRRSPPLILVRLTGSPSKPGRNCGKPQTRGPNAEGREQCRPHRSKGTPTLPHQGPTRETPAPRARDDMLRPAVLKAFLFSPRSDLLATSEPSSYQRGLRFFRRLPPVCSLLPYTSVVLAPHFDTSIGHPTYAAPKFEASALGKLTVSPSMTFQARDFARHTCFHQAP